MSESSPPVPDPPPSPEIQMLERRLERIPRGSFGQFLSGSGAFFRGLGFLLRHPRYVPLVVLPFLLNVVLFIFLIYLAFHYYDAFHESFFRETEPVTWWDSALNWLRTGGGFLARILFWALIAITWFYTFVIVGSIIAAPFNDLLSDRIESHLIPEHAVGWAGWGAFTGDIIRGILHELVRAGIFGLLCVMLLPLWLVPVVGAFIYLIIIDYVGVWYLVWDGMDYCLSRRRLGFSAKWAFYRQHHARVFGFGLMSLALLWVPLMAIFVIPLNVAGGSVLYCEIVRGGGSPRR